VEITVQFNRSALGEVGQKSLACPEESGWADGRGFRILEVVVPLKLVILLGFT